MRKNKILIVSAHPDDEVIGCGGAAARLALDGCEVFTMILGEGITSRCGHKRAKEKDVLELKKQALKANKILGVKDVFFFDLPDNKFDTIPLLDIVKIIEQEKGLIKPDIVFTHYENDLNIDHRITYQAVLTATRPVASETVKEVYSFEVASSTEWGYPLLFSPDHFYDIAGSLDRKLSAMECYELELKKFPHPRSLEGLKLNAKYWGMRVGVRYAEAFKTVRVIT